MRCDSDPIFKGSEYKSMTDAFHVDVSYSAPYTPTQNTMAERRWGIAAPSARAMLHTANLQPSNWEFAMLAACYLDNRTYHAGANGIPITLVTRNTPDLSRLRIFGCPTFVHIPAQHRRKMEDTAFRGVLLGYSTDTYGYLVYNPKTRQVVTTRHVRFD